MTLGRPNLDLVLDNPELKFPTDGPRFKFIFWEHAPENLPAILPLLEDCGVIAKEVAYYHDERGMPAGESIWEELAVFNSILAGTMTAAEKQRFVVAAQLGNTMASICLYFEASGKTVVPIDEFASTTREQYESMRGWLPGFRLFLDKEAEYPKVIRNDLKQQIDHARRRENTSLRQLYELTQKHAPEDKNQTVGVVYGAGHQAVYVAAVSLGARAERHIIGSQHRVHTPLEVFEKQVRFGLKTVEDLTDELIHHACLLEMADIAIAVATLSPDAIGENPAAEEMVRRRAMEKYRTDRENCIALLSNLHLSLNDGSTLAEQHQMQQAAKKVLDFVR
jgi:hypothetical protein